MTNVNVYDKGNWCGLYENSTILQLFCKSKTSKIKSLFRDFPGGAVVKNLPANAGDIGSIPGPGTSHMTRSN